MAQSYTAEDLVDSLRRRALIPEAAAAGTLALADLIALMSEELQEYIIPEVLSLSEEFSVADYDFSTTDGRTSYPFPPRAVGPKLKDVQVLDGNGSYYSIQRVRPEDAQILAPGGVGSGAPIAYYLKANSVVFVQNPGVVSVRLSYYLRPNALILTEDAGLITAINTGTGVVTVSNVPNDFADDTDYDFIQATPHFETRGMDVVGDVTGSTLVFGAGNLPTGLEIGDYVCLAGESPIPQLPIALRSLLAQRTAVKALEALGDPKVQVAQAMCADSLKRAQGLLNPRVDEAPRYIVNRNGPGFGWRR